MADCQNGNSNPEIARPAAPTHGTTAVFRVLDANLNRASEGLRVAEEYARFILDDRFLSKELKQMRHTLAASVQWLGGESMRLAFRDVSQDVGALISVPSETAREGPKEVAHAALKRTQQALRSLEEYGKTISDEFASACERMRYEVYTLEKAMLGVRAAAAPMAAAQVYALLSGQRDLEAFELAAQEIAAVADAIQLRDKSLTDAALLERARTLRSITRKSNCIFIVNDRPDIAFLSDADGVHLGQHELGVHEARRLLGAKATIGVSTHSVEQLRKAILEGASYVGCGPVFASQTKNFQHFPGLDYLKLAAQETSLPSFAIGGIDLHNVDRVIEAGFHRVAVQGAIFSPNNSPAEVIKRLKAKLRRPD